MKIILDTNVIYRDYKLDSGWVLKLSDATKKLGSEPEGQELLYTILARHS